MTEPRHPLTEFANRELASYKKAYDTGALAALYDALDFCLRCKLRAPDWVLEAMMKALEQHFAEKLSLGRGRTGNARSKARAEWVHFVRWDTVRSLRDNQKYYREECEALAKLDIPDEKRRQVIAGILDAGNTWEDAYEHAANDLKGTEAYGSPSTMKRSYLLVQKSYRDPSQYGRFYLASHRTRTKLGIDV